MKKILIGIALLLTAHLFQGGYLTFAAELNADKIITKMKAAFEPKQACTRTLNFFIKDHEKVTNTWVAREARNALPDGKKTLLVMIEPDEIKGFARLIWERQDKTNLEWMYLPSLKRITKLTPVNAYDSFRGTDFTYSDIGFINVHGTHKLLGEVDHKGTAAYKIETIPEDKSYYSRIVTLVSKENFLPLERDLYDVVGALWKTQLFEEVTVINNIPTPFRVTMNDVQVKTSTGYKVSEVCYGAVLPDEIFQPKGLPNALQYDFCPLPQPTPTVK